MPMEATGGIPFVLDMAVVLLILGDGGNLKQKLLQTENIKMLINAKCQMYTNRT